MNAHTVKYYFSNHDVLTIKKGIWVFWKWGIIPVWHGNSLRDWKDAYPGYSLPAGFF